MFKWPTNPKNPKITVKCLNCLTLESQFFQKKIWTVTAIRRKNITLIIFSKIGQIIKIFTRRVDSKKIIDQRLLKSFQKTRLLTCMLRLRNQLLLCRAE